MDRIRLNTGIRFQEFERTYWFLNLISVCSFGAIFVPSEVFIGAFVCSVWAGSGESNLVIPVFDGVNGSII